MKADVCLSSISGGTDIVSCFALGNPILPVWRGELQCRGLGMAVDVFSTVRALGFPIEVLTDPGDTMNRYATHILEDIQTCVVEGLTTGAGVFVAAATVAVGSP